MRKFLSLLLTTAMLIAPTGVFAENDYNYDIDTYAVAVNPVFDADFSAFATNGTISDKSGASQFTVTKNGDIEGKTVTIGENTINYLHFGGDRLTQSSKNGSFKVNDNKLTGFGEMTVEIWTKPDIWNAETNEKVLFSLTANTKTTSVYDVTMKETDKKINLAIRLDSSDEKKASVDITDYMKKWTHFVFVRSFDSENETATVKAYINGEEKINQTFEQTAKADESGKSFRVGSYGDNMSRQSAYIYKGGISEVRVYNKELETANISRNYIVQGAKYIEPEVVEPDPDTPVDPDQPDTPETGDVLFELEVGNTVSDLKDVSGNGVEVKTSGSVGIEKYTGGLGDINYVTVTTNQWITFADPSFLNQKETTIEFYMLTPEFASYPHPFVFGSSAVDFSFDYEMTLAGSFDQGNYFVGKKDDSHRSDVTSGIKARLSAGLGAMNSNKWTHFVVTRKLDQEKQTAEINVYINGKLFSSSNNAKNYVTDKENCAFYFGDAPNRGDKGNCYTGGFAEIRIYKKVLSADEVFENLEKNLSKYSPTVLTNNETFGRSTSSLSFALNGVDLSNGYTFSFEDVNDSDKKISGTATKTDSGFDVNFGQYFKYGQEIQFTLSTKDSGGNETKTFITKSVPKGNSEVEVAVVGGKGEITKPDGSDTYIVDITTKNNGTDSVNYKYVLIAKNENGASIACTSGEFSVSGGSNHTEFDVLEKAKKAKEIDVYVWENNGGMLVPLYGMPLILK